MPRKTLGERAYAFANKKGHDNSPYWKTAYGAWLAGHRANRLTAKERAVVEAVRRDRALLEFHDADGILEALNALERAKGRK